MRSVILVLWVLLGTCASIDGQEIPSVEEVASQIESPEPSSSRDLEDLHRLRAAVAEEIQALGGRVSSSGVVSVVPPSEDPDGGADSTAETLHRPIAGVVGPAQSLLARIDAQISLLSRADIQSSDIEPGPDLLKETSTVGFSVLDSMLDALEDAEAEARIVETRIEEIRSALEDAERRAEYLERRERRTQGESEDTDQASIALLLSWQLRVAREDVHLERLRLASAERSLVSLGRQIESYRDLVAQAEEQLEASPELLSATLEQIEARVADEEEGLFQLESRLDEANRAWLKVSRKPGGDVTPESDYRQAVLQLLEIERQARLERLEMLELAPTVWRHRYATAGLGTDLGRSRREEELKELSSHLDRLLQAEQRRSEELRSRLQERMEPIRGEGESRWIVQEVDALEQVIELVASIQSEMEAMHRLTARTLKATRAESVHGKEVMDSLRRASVETWNFELFSIDGNPITLGKSVVVLLLIVLGYATAKRVSRFFADLLVRRFSVSSGVAHAMQSFVFYFLTVSFALWGLELVGIPLTVFTLLGGVVAIGVGFGSQNVVNNFISGLILLIERPIKLGDLIDVDGVIGTVESIGLRSTRIRAGDNTRIIVPNSSFLEKNVLNWTGSDSLLRSKVDIGVAYGSPVERVRELLMEGLLAEKLVAQKPSPEVLFMEFGDNALLFRAYFWLTVRAGLDPSRVQSALRFRFDKLMADADIVIAFPQRDVHLDTISPLRIELTKGTGPKADSAS